MEMHELFYTLQELRWRFTESAQPMLLTVDENRQFRAAQYVVDDPAFYRRLSAQEGHTLAMLALDLFDAGFVLDNERDGYQWLPYCMLRFLADIVPGSLEGLYGGLVDRNLGGWWLGNNSLFREADPGTRDRIIALLEAGSISVAEAEDLACALAWIGDETVQRTFERWELAPPASLSTPHRPPMSSWPRIGGWELTAEGTRRDLSFQENYEVIPITSARAAGLEIPGPLAVATRRDDHCGWCGKRLMTLFDLDLRDPRLAFLGIAGERLRLPMCGNCTFQYALRDDRLYMDVDWSGGAEWSAINGQRPDEVEVYPEGNPQYVDAYPPPAFVLGAARRTPFDRTGAHLGGCPGWMQIAPDYPVCPVCRRTMLFVGQHDLNKVDLTGYEGYLYAFVCKRCQKATIGHQY